MDGENNFVSYWVIKYLEMEHHTYRLNVINSTFMWIKC